ncbi:ParA family protein, partial [Escherichia coli]|uniref:ParA family protein n=1 Tax=Escherichia coli TaxID=562 RepID=UPI001480B766
MPKVIALLNGKGGVSKTTSAVNIATALARKGYKVVVVDTDPQGSVSNWYDD